LRSRAETKGFGAEKPPRLTGFAFRAIAAFRFDRTNHKRDVVPDKLASLDDGRDGSLLWLTGKSARLAALRDSDRSRAMQPYALLDCGIERFVFGAGLVPSILSDLFPFLAPTLFGFRLALLRHPPSSLGFERELFEQSFNSLKPLVALNC
jgi:hypothetical protein